MQSKLQNTGYLQIDHRESPGLTDDQIQRFKSPIHPGMGRKNFQADIVKCWHCQTMIILNPLRTRPRTNFCGGCGRYLCDACYGAYKHTGVCKPFNQVIDEIIEAAIRAESIQEI